MNELILIIILKFIIKKILKKFYQNKTILKIMGIAF